MRKLIPFIVLSVGLVSWYFLDKMVQQESSVETINVLPVSEVVDPAPLDSAWYCPIGTRGDSGYANNSVNISNSSNQLSRARVTVLTEEGKGASKEVEVGGLSSKTVTADEIAPITDSANAQQSNTAALQVEVVGGASAVSHSVETSEGKAEGVCATNAASSWYFASGRVREDSRDYVALMNPFPVDISVDIKLETVGSTTQTIDHWQGLTIFANSVQVIEIHSAAGLDESEHVAVVVECRSGRIIAERLEIINEALFASEKALEKEVLDDKDNPENPENKDAAEGAEETKNESENKDSKVTGVSLQLGSPQPSQEWFFTSGRVNNDGSHFLTIYNPAEIDVDSLQTDTAKVLIDVWPTNPEDKEFFVFVPIEREVIPGGVEVVDLVTEIKRLGFEIPFDFSIEVVSQNEIPIVAERWQYGEKVQDAFDFTDDLEFETPTDPVGDAIENPNIPADKDDSNPPSITNNLMTSMGQDATPNSDWLIPWISTPSDKSTWITLFSPDKPAEVTVSYADGGALKKQTVKIPKKDSRAYVSIPKLSTGSSTNGGFVKIESNAPIYAEAQVISDSVVDTVSALPIVKG